jgi:hypothetical protein
MMALGSKMVGTADLEWQDGKETNVKLSEHPDALSIDVNTDLISTPVSTPRGEDISKGASETDYDMTFGEEVPTEGTKSKAKEEATNETGATKGGDKKDEPKATGYAAALLRKADPPPPSPSPKAKASSPSRRSKDTTKDAKKSEAKGDKKDESDSASSSTGGKRGWEQAGARSTKVCARAVR